MLADLQLLTTQHLIDLDIDNDKEIQAVLDLAASVCGTSGAFITIVDDNNQYLKAGKGVGTTITKSEYSFCKYTILQDEVLVIENASTDERFKSNPLVTGPMQIKFYAGTPLVDSNGTKRGALCVVDREIKQLSDHQKMVLNILAEKIMNITEHRVSVALLAKKEQQLKDQQKLIDDASIRLRSFFESSTNFQVLLGKNGEVKDFNKTADQFINRVHKTSLKRGENFITYIAENFVETFIDRYGQALLGKTSIEEGYTDYGEHGMIWWDATFEPAKDGNDKIVGISYLIRNVTERKTREQKIIKQNESLLNIAHIQAHEFRAPLTTVMGIISLMREDRGFANNEYFQFLEQAVDNLDVKIKGIVSSIEDNVVSNIAVGI